MMKPPGYRTVASLIILLLILSSPITAQQPNQAQKSDQQTGQAQKEPANVVRISTQLVQIDAVVTDNKGGHIEDLTENEFELTVDGKRQSLTYFSLVKQPEPKAIKSDKPANTTA